MTTTAFAPGQSLTLAWVDGDDIDIDRVTLVEFGTFEMQDPETGRYGKMQAWDVVHHSDWMHATYTEAELHHLSNR